MTMKSRVLTAVVIAALTPGAAFADPPSNRGPHSFFAKPDGTAEQRSADLQRCKEIVSKADGADIPPVDEPGRGDFVGPAIAQGGLAGAGAALILVGIFAAVDDAKATRRGQDLCMYNLGYRVIPMTKTELATYAKVPLGKQRQWERDYLPPDTAERLAPLLKPAVPRLPPYEPEAPLVDGGVKIADLTLVSPEIHDKGFVVKGTATRRRTATLVTPIETKDGDIRLAADAGTVFQEVDYRMGKEPMLRKDGSTWCATVKQMAAGNVAKDFFCFTGRDSGYEITQPSGYPWLAGPYDRGLILPVYTQPIQLEERKQDDLGPMDLELKVVKIENSGVYIACDVRYKSEAMRMWLRRIPFEKDVAVLPLWDSKLTLTRMAAGKQADKSARQSDKLLKAELTHDGDGKSWRAGEEARTLFEH